MCPDLRASYTFSRALNDASTSSASGSGLEISGNNANRRANYGPDFSSRAHRFIGSFVYQLPSPKRFNSFVNNLLGDWSVAGVTTIQLGGRLSLFGANLNNAFGVGTGAFGIQDRVQLAPGCTNLATSGSVQSRLNNYFNTNCINRANLSLPLSSTNPATWRVIGDDGIATTFGNSGVGIVTGPGQNNSDIAIIKRIPIRRLREGANVEFRTEFFNAFNHPQFDTPAADVTSLATFGTITDTSVPARLIQFALKLNF